MGSEEETEGSSVWSVRRKKERGGEWEGGGQKSDFPKLFVPDSTTYTVRVCLDRLLLF